MISVLMCDDHVIVRQGLRQILADTEDIQVAAECDNGADALRAVREQRFDVVLLDIAMPQRDGLDVLVQIKRESARQPVLMLSTYPDKQYAGRSFRLGAAGYLNKRAGGGLVDQRDSQGGDRRHIRGARAGRNAGDCLGAAVDQGPA